MFKPTNNALHQQYLTYIKTTARGGKYEYFGQYSLNVGCFYTPQRSVDFADNAAIVLNVPLLVGDSVSAVGSMYNFAVPTSTRTYCVPVSTSIVDPSTTSTVGTPAEISAAAAASWTGSAQLATT